MGKIINRPVNDPEIEPVYFAKVDCVKHEDIYYDENIESFPTLKFYFHGLPLGEYDGERDYESLQEFIDFLDYDNIDFDINTSDQGSNKVQVPEAQQTIDVWILLR